MNLKNQKYLIIFCLFILNITLSSTLLIFRDKWYIFIIFLSLPTFIYSFSSILILFSRLCSNFNNSEYELKRDSTEKNYLYLVPCYNESEIELLQTLVSLSQQKTGKKDKKAIMIICDGKVTGVGNNKSTDKILLDILHNKDEPIRFKYITRENDENTINLYVGLFDNVHYILMIKDKNYGKRDSIVLARRLIYNYNNNDSISIFNKSMNLIFRTTFNNKIEYIINIDADTIFDYNCTYELIKGIENHKDNVGCVGYVDINFNNSNIFNPFNLYQYSEYMYAQCLNRQAQSSLTHKVNCLSGCVQILKVCEENCGEAILEKFNYCPKDNDNIFCHIRGIASEDRNHICIMHSMYPNVRTVQNLNAISYTNVPKSIRVFLSQRRRWTLGASTNDLLLLFSPNINIFERIASFTNIFTLVTTPFIFIATILFFKSIFTNPTYLTLYLSIMMIIPLGYGLLIPVFIKRMFLKDALYYYASYIFFLTFGFVITLSIYMYSLFSMDTISWGKTRRTINNKINIYNLNELDWDYYDNNNPRETEV
jgi:chitin synthase